jgi:DNA (cytosine-5)-methyltransferase 1
VTGRAGVRAATCFSGIGAPEAAMPGWRWAWHAELEPFPAAVLAARHPDSANLGDVLAPDFDERAKALGPVDVLVGGPPCQAFSVAGNRNSLSDPRGNLSLRWAQIIHAVGPVFAVTENVPGWLNTPDDAFGHFLGALVGADGPLPAPGGRGWPRAGMVAGPLARACWRVLDAQYFDLAQRRERVFVVSSAGDRTDPSQILFELKSLRGYPAAGGEAGEAVARPLGAGSPGGSGYRNDADTAENLIATAYDIHGVPATSGATRTDVHTPLRARAPGQSEASTTTVVAYGGNDTRGPIEVSTALSAHGGPHGRLDFESETFVAHAFNARQSNVSQYGDMTGTLDTKGNTLAVAVPQRSGPNIVEGLQPALRARQTNSVGTLAKIRRLTPVECERLQGFPDGHTAIARRGKPAADGPRYRALGNSMAVPVVRWLLTRIEAQTAATVADEEVA